MISSRSHIPLRLKPWQGALASMWHKHNAFEPSLPPGLGLANIVTTKWGQAADSTTGVKANSRGNWCLFYVAFLSNKVQVSVPSVLLRASYWQDDLSQAWMPGMHLLMSRLWRWGHPNKDTPAFMQLGFQCDKTEGELPWVVWRTTYYPQPFMPAPPALAIGGSLPLLWQLLCWGLWGQQQSQQT